MPKKSGKASRRGRPAEWFRFTSSALPEETFHVIRFHGHEGLSELFSFTVDLVSRTADLDTGQLLHNSAELCILRKKGLPPVRFQGYPVQVEQGGHFGAYTYYTVELRPAFWRLSQMVQSALFLDKTVQEVTEELLNGQQFFRFAHEFRLTGEYPAPEFAMQYEENLYDYICWRLEEQGAYFYFAPDGDRIIFADAPHSHDQPVACIHYSPTSNLEGERQDEVVHSFVLTQTPLPHQVVLRSYDWKDPNRVIVGSALVSQEGMGDVYLPKVLVETEREANRLARIRAEALQCRSRVFTGMGSVPVLRPGLLFTLDRHYSPAFNRDYLVTTMTHEGGQEAFITLGLGIPLRKGADHVFYRNTFSCIESDVPWRPAHAAPRARITGVIRAFVDGAGSGDRAEMDEYGRYKLLFPFDISGRKAGKASCWIRLAGPQNCQDSGLNLPLLPGTEVVVSFIDGNPDQPLITGSLANGETGAITGRLNHNFAGLRTPGGNQITINDTEKKQGISLLTATGRGLTMSAGSLGMTTKSGDIGLDAASVFTADIANAAKSVATGYKVSHMATQDPKWYLIAQALAAAVEHSARSVDESLSQQNETCAWSVETTKILAANLVEGMGLVQALDEKKGRYGVRLSADRDTARSRLLVQVSKGKMIGLIAAWFALASGSALLDANAGADEVLENGQTESWQRYEDSINRGIAALQQDEHYLSTSYAQVEGDSSDGIRYGKVTGDLEEFIRQKTQRDEDTEELRALLDEIRRQWNIYHNPQDRNYFDSVKKRGKRKIVTSLLGELLPEILALLTVVMDNSLLKSKTFGGISLYSKDNNINAGAKKSLSLHSDEGIYLGTHFPVQDAGEWGLDRAADDYKAIARDLEQWTVTRQDGVSNQVAKLFDEQQAEDGSTLAAKKFVDVDTEVGLAHAAVQLAETRYEWMSRAGLHLLKTENSSLSMMTGTAVEEEPAQEEEQKTEEAPEETAKPLDLDGIHLDSDKKITLSATPNPTDRKKDAVVAVEPESILAAVQDTGLLLQGQKATEEDKAEDEDGKASEKKDGEAGDSASMAILKAGGTLLTLQDSGVSLTSGGSVLSFGGGKIAVTSPGSVALQNVLIDKNEIISTSGVLTLFGAIKIMGTAAAPEEKTAASDPVTAKYRLYTCTLPQEEEGEGDEQEEPGQTGQEGEGEEPQDQAMLKKLQDKLALLMPAAPVKDEPGQSQGPQDGTAS